MHRDEEFDTYHNLYTSCPEAHSVVYVQWLSCLLLAQIMKKLHSQSQIFLGLV